MKEIGAGGGDVNTSEVLNLFESSTHASLAAFVADTGGEQADFVGTYQIGDNVRLTTDKQWKWVSGNGDAEVDYDEVTDDARINSAQSDATQALANAATADSKAVAAQATADAAQSTANSAQVTADAAEVALVDGTLTISADLTFDRANYAGKDLETIIDTQNSLIKIADDWLEDDIVQLRIKSNGTFGIKFVASPGAGFLNVVNYALSGNLTAHTGVVQIQIESGEACIYGNNLKTDFI